MEFLKPSGIGFLEPLNTDMKKIALSLEDIESIELTLDERDALTIEDGYFGFVSDIGAFFKKIFNFIKEFFNIKKKLERMFTTGIFKELKRLQAKFIPYLKKLNYSDYANIQIAISSEFSDKVKPLSEYLLKTTPVNLDNYNKFMKSFNSELGLFIGDEKVRASIAPSKPAIPLKDIEKADKKLLTFLKHSKNPTATVDDMFGGLPNIIAVLDNTVDIYREIDENMYKSVMSRIEETDKKLEALHQLIEVEKVPVSKVALDMLVEKINIAAKFSTLIGKESLATYECGRLLTHLETIITNTIRV